MPIDATSRRLPITDVEIDTVERNSLDLKPTQEIRAIFDGYIDEREYCRQRGISLRTAQRDRQLHQGPPYVSIGQRVMYRVAAVREWLLSQEQRIGSNKSRIHRGDRR